MPLAKGRHQANCQQHQGRDRVGFIVAKGPTGYGIRRTEHVDDSDRREKWRFLEQPNEEIAERRQHRWQGLRDDHMAPCRKYWQAERMRRIPLTLADSINTGSVHLGNIGANMEAKT